MRGDGVWKKHIRGSDKMNPGCQRLTFSYLLSKTKDQILSSSSRGRSSSVFSRTPLEGRSNANSGVVSSSSRANVLWWLSMSFSQSSSLKIESVQ